MAIQKSIATQYGIPATEWRVLAAIPVQGDPTSLEVTYNGYANAQVADAKMQPLTQMRVQVPNVPYADDAAIDAAVLKEQTEFTA